jgi:hypothetical protein
MTHTRTNNLEHEVRIGLSIVWKLSFVKQIRNYEIYLRNIKTTLLDRQNSWCYTACDAVRHWPAIVEIFRPIVIFDASRRICL